MKKRRDIFLKSMKMLFDNYDKEYWKQIKQSGEPYIMDPYVYELMGKTL